MSVSPTDSTTDVEQLRQSRWRGITSLRRHTARGVLVNGAFDAALIGVSAFRGLIVAAFLTRSQYGVWGLLGLAMWTALALKNQFGAGDKYVQQSEANQELAFQRAFTIEAIFAAGVAPAAGAIVMAYALISGHTVVIVPGLLLLLMLPAVVLEFPLSIFYRQMNYRTQRRLQAVDPVVGAIATIGLAVAGAGYWSFVIGTLIGSWTGAAVSVRASPFRLAFRYQAGSLRSYLQFSGPLAVAALCGIAMFQIIYLVGSDALGLAGIGTFTLVGNFVQFTDQADATVTNTLYPAVCAVQDRLSLLAEIFVKSNRLSLMWAVPFGVGLALFARDLVHFLLGAKWAPAVPLLEIMGLVTAIHHVGYNWTAFLRARSDTRPIAVLGVVGVVAFIAPAVPLMYTVGLVGLGYAFAFSEIVQLFMRGRLLARLFQGFRPLSHLARAFAPTLVAALPVLLLRALVGAEPTLLAAAAVFAGYVVLTFISTGLIERALLREAVGYVLARRAKQS